MSDSTFKQIYLIPLRFPSSFNIYAITHTRQNRTKITNKLIIKQSAFVKLLKYYFVSQINDAIIDKQSSIN